MEKMKEKKISGSNWIEQNQTFFATINSRQVLKMTSSAFGLDMQQKKYLVILDMHHFN